MMKRMLSLLAALVLLFSVTARAEENVYDLIENALYRIVLRTEKGDETLGSGVLFSDKQLLLTSAACVAEGDLIAIGPDGEHALSCAEMMEESGLALLEMAAPAIGTPLHLASEDAAGMAALFGATPDGGVIVAPLNHVRATIFRGQSALLLSSSDGMLPGSFLTDETGSLIALCVAQQAEGQGAYIALDANGLYRALSRQQYADSFLPVESSWQSGELTITWTDEERDSGVYLITLSGDHNQYYTFFEAAHDERAMSIAVPPQHRYDFQVQWAQDADSALEPMWASMSEAFIPGASFTQYGFQQECSFATRASDVAPVKHIDRITPALLSDASLKKYLHVNFSHNAAEETELSMSIELIAPDGQFYFESALHILSPDKKQDDFLLPLDDLLEDCAEFSGGSLPFGQYTLRYALCGRTAGEYVFTLKQNDEADVPAEGADSGFITDLSAEYKNGLVTLSWPAESVPEGAEVTVYHTYEGNSYYIYYPVEPGAHQSEIFTVPGRHTVIWVSWTLNGAPSPEPAWQSDLLVIPGAQEAPFTLHGFENQRLALSPSADPQAEEKGEFLPEVTLTREILMDAATPLYFQTEDTYQVDEMSEDHPMVLALCTPEGMVFAAPLLYIFDPALQESDVWLNDLSSLCRDYESLVQNPWPAGEYRLMYCIDGQIAGEILFTLE